MFITALSIVIIYLGLPQQDNWELNQRRRLQRQRSRSPKSKFAVVLVVAVVVVVAVVLVVAIVLVVASAPFVARPLSSLWRLTNE